MTLDEILALEFLDNTAIEWGAAIFLSVFMLALFWVVQKIGLAKAHKLAAFKSKGLASSVIEALQSTKWLVLSLIALYIGMRNLALPDVFINNFRIIVFALGIIQVGLWTSALLTDWTVRYRERQIKTNPAAVTTMGAVKFVLQLLIWVAVLLLILDNIGIDVTALVAGLGIGGVAVALAVQNILGDLFASLSIVLDKTFVVGDFIIVGEYLGAVEHIGLKTTRIRSLSGEQIVFSNSDLLKGRIRNYGRMFERRIEVRIGVTYQTSLEKLKLIPGIIKDAIESQDKTRFDRAHFLRYGDSSLDFEYIYFVLSPDYNIYMDINQEINFILYERFAEEGIEFAYPTRMLYVQNMDQTEEKDMALKAAPELKAAARR